MCDEEIDPDLLQADIESGLIDEDSDSSESEEESESESEEEEYMNKQQEVDNLMKKAIDKFGSIEEVMKKLRNN